jgi:hypothetical protein
MVVMIGLGRFYQYIKISILILFLSAVVNANQIFAQSNRHPYRAKIMGSTKSVIKISSNLQDGVKRRSSPALSKNLSRFIAFVPGSGRFNFKLDQVNFKSWDSFISLSSGAKKEDLKDVILVSGTAKRGNRILPVGGSIYRDDKNKVQLRLILQSSRGNIGGRSLYLQGSIESDKKSIKEFVVASVPAITLKNLACGMDSEPHLHESNSNHQHQESEQSISAAATTDMVNVNVATIATDADPEWYAKYGDSSNAQIATLVSAASSIYRSQMGIAFQITAQNVFTTSSGNPYTSSDPYVLLPGFKNYTLTNGHLGSADLYHLFSGKDFNGSVIGLAWVGVVCSVPDYAFGITQAFFPSADAAIVAHEIGHNMGGPHDSTDSRSIMAPYVNIPGSTYFSAASINAIQTHLNSSPNCLDAATVPNDDSPIPSPTPTPDTPEQPIPSISVTSSVSATGVMTLRIDLGAAPVDGCTAQVYGSPKRNKTGTKLLSITPIGKSTIFRLAGLRDPKTRNSLISLTARYSCDAGTANAPKFANVSLDKIRKKTSSSTTKILSSIKSAFAMQSRRRNLN